MIKRDVTGAAQQAGLALEGADVFVGWYCMLYVSAQLPEKRLSLDRTLYILSVLLAAKHVRMGIHSFMLLCVSHRMPPSDTPCRCALNRQVLRLPHLSRSVVADRGR